MKKCLLFAYDLLMPTHRPPQTMSHFWEDAINGLLYDLGPYPGAVNIGRSNHWVQGFVLEVDQDELPLLDHFEDVDSGEYTRRTVTTRLGHLVWVYEYSKAIPAGKNPIPRWHPPKSSPT